MRKRAGRNEYLLQGDDESIFTLARASVDVESPGEHGSRGGRWLRWMTRVGTLGTDRRASDATRRHSSRVD